MSRIFVYKRDPSLSHPSVHVVAGGGERGRSLVDVEISHLVFVFLWPFVFFPPFSRVRFPLAARFRALLVQVCSRPRSRGRAPKSFTNKLRGGRESDALLHSCLGGLWRSRAARVGSRSKGADGTGRIQRDGGDRLL